MYVYRHPKASCKSARTLKNLLGCRLLQQGGKKPIRYNSVIINYGVCDTPDWGIRRGVPRHQLFRWINHPSHVRVAANKLACLQRLSANDVPTVYWVTHWNDVVDELVEGHLMFARTILNGHSGQGIRLITPEGVNPIEMDIVQAPLYTRNYPKTHEYRVFVCDGRVIDIVQKRARRGYEENRKIRTHANGWVFAHELSGYPSNILDIAVRATAALQLDFAAVDIMSIKSRRTGEWKDNSVVCEVNTAPALENTVTKEVMRDALQSLARRIQ